LVKGLPKVSGFLGHVQGKANSSSWSWN
jgi:hypothetical protein